MRINGEEVLRLRGGYMTKNLNMRKLCCIVISGLLINIFASVFSYGVQPELKKVLSGYLESGNFNLHTVLGTSAKDKELNFAEMNVDQLKGYIGQWTVLQNEKGTQDGEFKAEKTNGKIKVVFKGIYHSYLAGKKTMISPDFCGLEIKGSSEFFGKTKGQIMACFGKKITYHLEKGDSRFGVLPSLILTGEDSNKRVVFGMDKKGKTTGNIEIKLLSDW